MRTLSKLQFLILTSLLRYPMHIYAIRQEIIELTDHRYYPTSSTLKRTVDGLLRAGLIEDCYSNPHYWLKAKRGTPYELTPAGRKWVKRELAMYFRLCQIGRMWQKWATENVDLWINQA